MKVLRKILQFGVIGLVLAFLVVPMPVSAQSESTSNQPVKILFFYGQGCPHCAKVEAYFQQEKIYDNYPVEKLEVYFNRDNSLYYNQLMDQMNFSVDKRGVPTLVVGDQILVGDEPIISQFKTLADAYLAGTGWQPGDQTDNTDPVGNDKADLQDKGGSGVSIPVIVGASLVDAINPCAFAVLVILMTTVISKKNRKQALYSGLSFSAAIFISYILMGLGIYKAVSATGIASSLTIIVGTLAIVLGLFNLKDWLWYGKLFHMEVPMSWRPRMTKLIESVTSPVGAFAVGLLVSLFLLPCTSGPYLVVLGLLARNPFDIGAIGYLLLYNLIFISPMLIITTLVYKGMSTDKLSYMRESNLERLHLIAGIILVLMGAGVLLWG